MAFLGNDNLSQILPNLIDPFDASRLKSAHYELSIGEEAFVTGDNSDSKTILAENESITIEPSQFALLLTEEKVTIPNDKIAFISIKAGQKFKGLVNISGFHVDPGFEGELLFSVYNAGPSKILLERGQKCFLIWYSQLIENGNASYNGVHNNQEKIPIKHIENLTGDLASPNSVLKKINLLEKEYEKRITTAEGNTTTWRWMLGIFISLLIFLNIKQYYNSNEFNSGYKFGVEAKRNENKQIIKFEQIIIRKLDSLDKVRAIESDLHEK